MSVEYKENDLFYKMKYYLILWVSALIMLMSILTLNIIHQNKVDAIWEQYEIDMKELHNERK